MQSEYLIFNAVVIGSVLVSLPFVPRPYWVYRWHAIFAVLITAVPFLAWDIAVSGRHWGFNPAYTLPWRAMGLPAGEWLFFLTVPLACLFTWEMIFHPIPAGERRRRVTAGPARLAYILFIISIASFGWGWEYTALASLSLAAALMFDRWTGLFLCSQHSYRKMAMTTIAFTCIFNGYLTALPVVLYGRPYQIGRRIGSIPVEDFIYGLALVTFTLVIYENFKRWWPRSPRPTQVASLRRLREKIHPSYLVQKWVESRLGPYRVRVVEPRPDDAARVSRDHRVAIIGSGLAGLRAASVLAQRGVHVDLYEQSPYLGGKIGGWTVKGPDEMHFGIEHGFHAFFPHYYNTYAFLEEVGARTALHPVEDYFILAPNQKSFSYLDTHKTPVLNMLSLSRLGHYRLRDLFSRPQLMRLMALLRYDPVETPRRFDQISFQEFATKARIPDSLRLTFNSFSRAFFAPPEKMSMGELIKSFHFFFLGQDGGLIYESPTEDYQSAILDPIAKHLKGYGATLHTHHEVTRLERSSTHKWTIHAQNIANRTPRTHSYDDVILACDLKGVTQIIENSPKLCADYPDMTHRLTSQKRTSHYAVWRIWIDRATPQRWGIDSKKLPLFVITDRRSLLDSITFYHRFEPQSKAWVAKRNYDASVLELHCYCVPDALAYPEACKAAFLEDLFHYIPSLRGANIEFEYLQLKNDFPAFHVGEHQHRPTTTTDIPGLFLAGDWVSLPYPAMLMEAATMSGLFAANGILTQLGVQQAAVDSVPHRGLLA